MTDAVSPARRCAFAVVRRTFEDDAYADRVLRAEARAAGLEGRELAFATQLAFGTVQRRGTLDHLIEGLADRPVTELDPGVLAALRLGLQQVCFLGGVADHAAVGEAVELAKGCSRGGGGLVNAVLRRAVREREQLLARLSDDTAAAAAIKHSHPEWIARLWWDALGPQDARALLASDNEPAEAALRANALVIDRDELAARLPIPSRPADGLPEGLVLEAPFDSHGSQLWRDGAFMPQSRASMLVARVLGPRSGERVLDLCAAPGGKTTHIAALMGDAGAVVAIEANAARAAALGETCARMRATCVDVRVEDARAQPGAGQFDRVLVDPPCSGLGTLRSRPDLRWRADPEGVAQLAQLQGEILSAGARAVRPGGTLVYSTCTISPAENEGVIDRFVHAHLDFATENLQADHPLWKHLTVADHLQLMPHRDRTDGFFIARLRRAA